MVTYASSRPVDGTGWRKKYYQSVIHQLTVFRDGHLKPELVLPITSRHAMFEFGGSKYASGIAMLVATPSGFPNAAIVLKTRVPNGLHVASKVWIGCLVGIAYHKFGTTTVGIYRLDSIVNTTDETSAFGVEGVFSLVVGISKKSQDVAHDLRWLAPFDKRYPGLRRLTFQLLRKVELFGCTVPLYLEPFRTSSDSISALFKCTDLETLNTTDVTPKFVTLIKNMTQIQDFSLYSQLEPILIDLCYERSFFYPFVYLLLCHHLKDSELLTHIFVGYKDKTQKVFNVWKTGYCYTHYGIQQNYSTDLEGYIATNYNRAYLYTLLGTTGGGISSLLKKIKMSKDGCHYVLLRYALSVDSTKPSIT